jgi:site-specific recombinase XerD
MKPRSAKSHLATIRGRYGEIIRDNRTRDLLYTMAGAHLADLGQPDTIPARKAVVDELLARLANGTDPKHSAVKVETIQDKTDEQYGIRLTRDQASALLAAPGLVPIDRLRDTAILAMFLCTGIRADELCNLEAKDLRQTKSGELCLHVRGGKGNKTRVVFYGGNEWVLAYIDKWLAAAGILEGAVFRGFYKPKCDGSRKLRDGRLSVRAVQRVVENYPVMVGGELTTLHCHDLRRTYAKNWHDGGGDLVGLQQNLGHASLETTLGYIGLLDASKRQPLSMYNPPHWSELESLEIQGRIEESEGA